MSFKSAEKVYQYMSDLTETVGRNYKGRFAQFITDL